MRESIRCDTHILQLVLALGRKQAAQQGVWRTRREDGIIVESWAEAGVGGLKVMQSMRSCIK